MEQNFMTFIKPELLVLVPVLYFVGVGLKKSEYVADRFIPIALGTAGIVLSVIWVLATTAIVGLQAAMMAVFVALTQGILCAGLSVYVHQIFKQATKGDERNE